MNRRIVRIKECPFAGKQNINWNEVEAFLKKYIGKEILIDSTKDKILIPKGFPDEYTGSAYTKKLRGAVAKAKANATTELEALVKQAENRRYVENKEDKHEKDASKGWYRYDTFFSIPVRGEDEKEYRENIYRATLVVRINNRGCELYDVVNIKKEASKPLEP